MKLRITVNNPSPDVLESAMEIMIDMGYREWGMAFSPVQGTETLVIEIPHLSLEDWTGNMHDFEMTLRGHLAQEIPS
jgi:hypothetical protein